MRSTWIILTLIAAALLAGCGSSNKSTSSSSSSTPAATSSTPAAGATTPTIPASTTGVGAAQSAVAVCDQVIKSLTVLPASAKSKLESVCKKAANGNAAEIRAAAEKICLETAAQPGLPTAVKERVLQACKSAGG